MVCVPCFVIPALLWIFHKYIQPFIMKFWKPQAVKNSDGKSVDTNVEGSQPQFDKDCVEYQYVKKLIDANPVMIFSKTTCRYSDMAKGVFDEVGASYCIEHIDRLPNMADVQDCLAKLTGARTVPRVFVGGKCIGGGSETWTLHNKGELVPMLQSAGASLKKLD